MTPTPFSFFCRRIRPSRLPLPGLSRSVSLIAILGVWMGSANFSPALAAGPCQSPPAINSAALANGEDCRHIHQPANPTEFLRNIRQIYTCDFLSKSEFYQLDNLTKIFGGSKIQTIVNNTKDSFWVVDYLSDLFQETEKYYGADVDIGRETSTVTVGGSGEITKAHVSTGVGHDTRLTVALAEEIFGKSDEIVTAVGSGIPGMPIVWPPKTNTLGYMALRYPCVDGRGRYKMDIVLGGDGTILQLTLSMKEP